jgi:S1-C subfamily serine protease
MKKNIFKIIAVLILGAIGGMLFQAFILPYLINNSYFGNFLFIKNLKREAIVNPVEKIVIEENTALEDAFEKVEKAVVGLNDGSGLIITSDGLIVTLADLLPKTENYLFLGGEKVEFEVSRKDLKQNLALIKINRNNLTVCGFADLAEIKIGQRVFLVGVIIENEIPKKIINEGIIKIIDEGVIRTNIFEKSILKGSPLFNIKGETLGLNTIDSEGKVTTIPMTEIRKFAGF